MSEKKPLHIIRSDSQHPDFQILAAELTQFLAIHDGEQASFFQQFNKADSIPYVVVAYLEDRPVACGAIRPFSETEIEVKRMYVVPDARGAGISRAILEELETWATELGFPKTILETSIRLTAAFSLYQNAGYAIIPNYGPYVGVEASTCFGKAL